MNDKAMTREEMLDARTIRLQAALCDAQAYAKSVEKEGRNAYHSYNYASAEGIIAEARSALSQFGLSVSSSWDVRDGRIYVTHRLMHREGGREIYETSTPVIPDKGRPSDKAEATALTYNLGYFLRGLLLLPRVEKGSEVDDRDDNAREDEEQLTEAKITYEGLLFQMAPETKKKIQDWIKSRGESIAAYNRAILLMQQALSKADTAHNL